jgi:hypothetical protein
MYTPREAQLLREVGGISDRIRALREKNAGRHGPQIKALEAESRIKWEQLRSLRAAPVTGEPELSRRSLWS